MDLNQIITKLKDFKNGDPDNEIEVGSVNFNGKFIEVYWNYKGSQEIHYSLL